MRNMIVATALGIGLVVAGPAQMALGEGPAAAQGHGGGGFHGGGRGGDGHGGGGGFRGGEGFHGGGGGYSGGFRDHDGGYRGGYYGGRGYYSGFGSGYYGNRGYYSGFGGGYYGDRGYYAGFGGGYYGGLDYGYGYGCCGYYGDGAGLLLGAAAVAGVTALAVDSAYDRSYYSVPSSAGYYDAPVVPAGYYDRATVVDRRTLIDRCAHIAEDDAHAWASSARFAHVDSFDRDAAVARIEGTIDVTVAQERSRYDRDGFPTSSDSGLRSQPVHFTCQTDGGNVVALHLDRPGER